MKSFGDWGGFFAKMSAERMIWLAAEFGIDPSAPTASISTLADEAYGRLTYLRASVEDLARPDSYVLSDKLAELPVAAPTGGSAEDRAVWLAENYPEGFQDALEMIDYDKSYQRDAFWTGVAVEAPIRLGAQATNDNALRSALAACLKEPNRPPPDILLHAFSRAHPRSGDKAVHLTISYAGPLQSYWAIRDRARVLTTFAPERLASVIIDPEARTIDVVSREANKTLRSKLVATLLQHMGAPEARTAKITPRIVHLHSLADRRTFPLMAGDEVDAVRLVGVKLLRRPLGDLSIDARVSEAADAWEAWDGWVGSGGGFGHATIRSATLEFVFPAMGKGKPRRRLLRLHGTSGIVQRGWSTEHSAIADTLLMRWGLLSRPDTA